MMRTAQVHFVLKGLGGHAPTADLPHFGSKQCCGSSMPPMMPNFD